MTMGFKTWRDERGLRTCWTFWMSDDELSHRIPEFTRDLISHLSQSPLLSSQVCALFELVSAIEQAQARESLDSIIRPPPSSLPLVDDMHLPIFSMEVPPDIMAEIRQRSLDCRLRLVDPTGALACNIWGIRCHGRLDCPKFRPISAVMSLSGIMQEVELNGRL